jgi:hypothetical protein
MSLHFIGTSGMRRRPGCFREKMVFETLCLSLTQSCHICDDLLSHWKKKFHLFSNNKLLTQIVPLPTQLEEQDHLHTGFAYFLKFWSNDYTTEAVDIRCKYSQHAGHCDLRGPSDPLARQVDSIFVWDAGSHNSALAGGCSSSRAIGRLLCVSNTEDGCWAESGRKDSATQEHKA